MQPSNLLLSLSFFSPQQMSVAWRKRAAIHPDLRLFLPFKPEQARLMPLPHFSAALLLLYRLCSRLLLYFPLYPPFSYFSPPNSLPLSLWSLCFCPLITYFHLHLLSFTSCIPPFASSSCEKKKKKRGGGGLRREVGGVEPRRTHST